MKLTLAIRVAWNRIPTGALLLGCWMVTGSSAFIGLIVAGAPRPLLSILLLLPGVIAASVGVLTVLRRRLGLEEAVDDFRFDLADAWGGLTSPRSRRSVKLTYVGIVATVGSACALVALAQAGDLASLSARRARASATHFGWG